MQNLSCPQTHERIYCSELYGLCFSLCANVRESSWQGCAASLIEKMGRGLQEKENPGNLLHLDKQNMHMNGWELAGAAVS